MPYAAEVKQIAYGLDPPCWVSYAGKLRSYKVHMDMRRTAALTRAQEIWDRRIVPLAEAHPRLDEAAERLCEWLGYAWDGIRDEGDVSIRDKGFEPWTFNGIGQKQFQGYRADLRAIVLELTEVMR